MGFWGFGFLGFAGAECISMSLLSRRSSPVGFWGFGFLGFAGAEWKGGITQSTFHGPERVGVLTSVGLGFWWPGGPPKPQNPQTSKPQKRDNEWVSCTVRGELHSIRLAGYI